MVMHTFTFSALIATCVGTLFLFIHWIFAIAVRPNNLPLPPGPAASWLGSIPLPDAQQWLTFASWKKIYGNLIFMNIFGNPVLVLNSAEAAHDLLEKRSGDYSSRPVRAMLVDIMGFNWAVSSMPYDNRWKQHRSLLHKHFHANNSAHRPAILKETYAMLHFLLDSPENYYSHVRRMEAAVIFNICYGHEITDERDEYVTLANKVLMGVAQAGQFGRYFVDYFPALKYIPAWMPGASFKRHGQKWRELHTQMLNRPYDVTKKKLQEGTAKPCLIATELEESQTTGWDPEYEQVIKNVSGTAYAAGAETSVSAIVSFLLAMVVYPDIQRKAQECVDRVVGHDRLPDFNDKEQLPYIDCIAWECLRWNPATPLGLPRRAAKDDTYNGYRIPKGTRIVANVWAILHNEEHYPDPLEFKPERFEDQEKNALAGINELPNAAFGFGRRICPGRWLAFESIWIAAATILSIYDVSAALDENGQPIKPDLQYTSGNLSRPVPFKCRITPRSDKAVALIQAGSR